MTSRLRPLALPDLTGRTALVTGGSSGIGLETARALSAAGASVWVTSRTEQRASDAAAAVGALPEVLDTSSFASVDALLERWGSRPVDVLVLNAGIAAPSHRVESVDGHELTLATNALGHVRLAHGLRDAVREASGRVVTVGSIAAHTADGSAGDLELSRRWSRGQAYSRSKLASIVLGLELPGRAGIAATPAHPGYATTPFFGDGAGWRVVAPVARRISVGQDSADGAQPLIAAAVGLEFPRDTGYLGPRRGLVGAPGPASLPRPARDLDIRAQWWDGLCDLSGVPRSWS
ncbi:MAG: SDR family NAD(P)-dependent oxidoreductase [Dermatophilus congolensis]|nr:SDR family NAD(P)-dependent oxidoreductase [Dermatophilus congolensis]